MRRAEDVTVIGRRHVCKDSRAPNDLPGVDLLEYVEMLLDVNNPPGHRRLFGVDELELMGGKREEHKSAEWLFASE